MGATYEILPDDALPAARTAATYEIIPDDAAAMPVRDAAQFDPRYDPSTHQSPPPPAPPPPNFGETGRLMTLTESFGAGLTNLSGWGDELLGALNAVYPANPAGPGGNDRPMAENYATMRDSQQAVQDLSRQTNPATTVLGDVAGSAVTMGAVPAPVTGWQALGQGVAVGAVGGAGESKGNLTSIDKAAELATDTGVSGVVGGVLGAGAYGVIKGGGALVNSLRPSVQRTRDAAKVNALRDSLLETFEAPVGAREAVTRTAKVYKHLEAASRSAIQKTAQEKFGLVDRLSGDAPSLSVKNALAAITNAKSRLSSVDKAALGKLNELERLYSKDGGLVTGGFLQRELSGWADAAKTGGREVFKDAPRARSRIWTTAILDGLRKDLDEAAAASGAQGELGAALLDARNTYHEMMTAQKAMKDNLLDSAVRAMTRNHPETMPFRLLAGPGAVSDDMVSRTIGTVAAIDRDAASGLRATALGALLKRARPHAQSPLGEAGGLLGPKALVELYGKQGSRIDALFTGDPAGLSRFRRVVDASKRLQVLGETDPSKSWFGTLQRMPWFRAGAQAANVVGTVTVLSKAIGAIGRKMDSRAIAKILSNPEDARLLEALMAPKTGTTVAQATRYATLLLEDIAEEETR